ncbi:MAG: DsbA family protein [Caldilineaceae bacterium]
MSGERTVGIYIGALFSILLAALLLSACAMPMLAPENSNAAPNPVPAADAPPVEVIDSNSEMFNGIPTGYTEEGYVYRGNPNAPITMYEYSDYQCPFCRRYFSQTESSINEMYVKSGQLKVVFKDFPLEQIHPNARAASVIALCAADQSPSAFWQMHNLLFETQDQWASLPDPAAFFDGLALQIDADKADFDACVNTGDVESMIDTAYADALALNFQGTPSFHFVNAETGDAYDLVGAQPFERFQAWLDAMIAGEAPDDATASDSGGGGDNEIPYWATAEGLSPDPDRPGYTMAGDEYRGSWMPLWWLLSIRTFNVRFVAAMYRKRSQYWMRNLSPPARCVGSLSTSRSIFIHRRRLLAPPLNVPPIRISFGKCMNCSLPMCNRGPLGDPNLIFVD